jgi:hypothetical protein
MQRASELLAFLEQEAAGYQEDALTLAVLLEDEVGAVTVVTPG